MERDSRALIKLLENDGWFEIGVTGSHHHFKHPSKPGKVTVPHPRKDIPMGTIRSVLKQAGLMQKK
ncbi:type II toxin-antitoxin system HicA family toxin [Aquibium carbonis]|uniref:Type II toxin-antitoxin system HicA family toxin n=1 Tax=Aquibium carbonis TaxID=2495581 RepID=A0A3R9Y991_9HYPH|nr:type II toxin-antitoxin system HicA family toxin [Aquibium carbonis]RST87003.1 type II toxin-antitoxin system HicA family toxin [Aquibium carbonis]